MGSDAVEALWEHPPEEKLPKHLKERLHACLRDPSIPGETLQEMLSLLTRSEGDTRSILALMAEHPNLPTDGFTYLSFVAPESVARNPGLGLAFVQVGVEQMVRRLNLETSVALLMRPDGLLRAEVRQSIAETVRRHPLFDRDRFREDQLAAVDEAAAIEVP